MPDIRLPQLLFSTDILDGGDAALARKALSGEPILVYPKGTHNRLIPWTNQVRTWTVDDAVVAQLVNNYANRTARGIRQRRLPVNEDHRGSRALGWFDRVVALPEGVGATFTWNRNGREALENGEFSYFSVEIYDETLDRVTGETVHNQIAGGALTNYPFFGEATSLMSRSTFTPGGDPMTEELERLKAERNWLQNLFSSLFSRSGDAGSPPILPTGIPEEFRQQFEQLQTQVGQFTTQLQAVQGERDAYAQQIQTLHNQLTSVQDARATERFAVLAEGFAHLPAATNDLAAHLRWLHEADPNGAHRDFFTHLLRAADTELERSFREFGMRNAAAGNAEAQLETRTAQYMADHPGTSYRDAVETVRAAHPELERQYHREMEGGR